MAVLYIHWWSSVLDPVDHVEGARLEPYADHCKPSRKHLGRYAAEFAFRWSTRQNDDGQRLRLAIRKADGKRLTYRELVGEKKSA